jgi:hypothetical protein
MKVAEPPAVATWLWTHFGSSWRNESLCRRPRRAISAGAVDGVVLEAGADCNCRWRREGHSCSQIARCSRRGDGLGGALVVLFCCGRFPIPTGARGTGTRHADSVVYQIGWYLEECWCRRTRDRVGDDSSLPACNAYRFSAQRVGCWPTSPIEPSGHAVCVCTIRSGAIRVFSCACLVLWGATFSFRLLLLHGFLVLLVGRLLDYTVRDRARRLVERSRDERSPNSESLCYATIAVVVWCATSPPICR